MIQRGGRYIRKLIHGMNAMRGRWRNELVCGVSSESKLLILDENENVNRADEVEFRDVVLTLSRFE